MRTANRLRLVGLALPLLLCTCQSVGGGKDTIATLRNGQSEIKEQKIEGGLEKAMEGYRRFLEETPESSTLKPEAIRRLADLKIEQEYGLLSSDIAAKRRDSGAALPPPERAARLDAASKDSSVSAPAQDRASGESRAEFEKRATSGALATRTTGSEETSSPGAENLERTGAREAI